MSHQLSKPPVELFRSELDANGVRLLQIIHLALGLGVTLVVAVTVFLHTISSYTDASPQGYLWTLTVVNLAITVTLFSLGLRMHDLRLSRSSLERRLDSEELTAGQCLNEMRVAHILRLAILETAAMFGTVICLLAVLGGAMGDSPYLWINLAPVALFLLVLGATIPSRQRLESVFETKVLAG